MDVSTLLRSQAVFLVVTFLARFLVFTYVERRKPAYRVDFWQALRGDLATTALLGFVTIPIGDRLVNRLPNPVWRVAPLLSACPLALRVALYLVLADLGHYWVHRALHTPLLWRLHKWHHHPTHMTWLAGNRESLPDRILVSLPYLLLWPLLGAYPWWLPNALLVFAMLKNDWMHLNVRLETRWLEWLVISPRYHHIHHSDDPAHYTKNCAPLFTLWDRLFGTYFDPSGTSASLRFGTGEQTSLPRLYTGL